MCAIVDAQVSHEVFGDNRSLAGAEFLDWIKESGRLVVGGKLFDELMKSGDGFREWAKQAQFAGKLIKLNNTEVNKMTERIETEEAIKSNDPHVLAVARISGARLLFSNERDLHEDFKNTKLINNPKGKIYSTLRNRKFTPAHRKLLSKNACSA